MKMTWNLQHTQLLFIAVLFVPCLWIGAIYNVDFIVLFDTTHLLAGGEWSRIYSNAGENGSIGRYFYGPFSLLVFSPFGFFDYPTAKAIWLALQSICYFLFWFLLSDLLPVVPAGKSRSLWLWVVVWMFAINPLHNNFQSNNIQLMLAVMLLGAEWLSRREKASAWFIAGALIAAAAAIKIFPYFLFAFFWLARPQLRKGLLSGLAITAVSPFVFLGMDKGLLLFKSFWRNVTSYGQDNSFLTVDDICCLPSLLARTLHRWGMSEAQSGPLIKVVIIVLSGIFIWYVMVNRQRLKDSRLTLKVRNECHEFNDTLWTLAFAMMVFLNPSTRPHYYIFYVPGLALIARRWADKKLSHVGKVAFFLAFILVALTQEWVTGKAINNVLEAANIPTYGMLILCALLVYGLVQSSERLRLTVTNAGDSGADARELS